MGSKPIGEMLKECRERAGLTQQGLAQKLHVARSVVTKVELGMIKQPSYALVKEWARVTESQELVSLDIADGKDGRKKLATLEAIVKQMKSTMDLVHFMKRKKV